MDLEQIRDIRFHKARKGYMPDEVDEFIEEVIVAFEELLNAQASDRQKLAEALQEAEECRARERSIGEALMAAQRQAEAVIKEAEDRAGQIVEEARAQAEAVRAEADQEEARRRRALDAMMQEAASFKSNLMEIYRRQLVLVEAMPGELPAEEEKAAEVLPESFEVQPEEAAVPERSEVEKMPVLTSHSHDGDVPSLFNTGDDDEDDEVYESAGSNSRYAGLEFGEEFEAPASRGLFRRKK